jgi:hypothetical protein
MAMDIGAHVVRFVGWDTTPQFSCETSARRIVVRFALPLDVARKMIDDLSLKMLGKLADWN